MSEKGPSPDKEPTKDPLHMEGVPDPLQLEAIDALRAKQAAREGELLAAARTTREARAEARDKARAEFDEMIKDHLLTGGVAIDDDKFAEYAALLHNYSIDLVPADKWDKGYIDDDGTIQTPVRQWAYDEINTEYSSDKKDTDPKKDDDPKLETDEEKAKREAEEEKAKLEAEEKAKREAEEKAKLETDEKKKETDEEKEKREKHEAREKKIGELEKEIEGLQKDKATAFAKRMSASPFKLIIPGQAKKLDAAFIEAEEAYLTKLEEYQKILIEKELEESKGSSYVDPNNQIALALNGRFTEILKNDYELQRQAMLDEGGFKAKVMEKYQNATPKQKVAIMIGIGAFLAAGGLTIAFGVIGGVAAGAAAVGIAGAKGTKTYLTLESRMYAEKPANNLKFEVDNPDGTSPEDALQQALNKLRSESRADIKSADRRKRVAIGLGALAAGGGSGLIHLIGAAGDGMFGNVGDALSPDVQAAMPPKVDGAHSWIIDSTPPAPKVMEFPPEAHTLSPGEGGYQAIRDAFGQNITNQQMHELWGDPKLMHELGALDNGFGRPLVYDMGGGQFGIRMTADGQMPQKALESMANRYHEMFGANPNIPGGIEAPTGVSNPIPTTIDHPVVSPSDVDTMKNVIRMDTIRYTDITQNAGVFDKLSYVQAGLDGEKYAAAMGLPNRVWLESLEPYISEQIDKGAIGYVDTFYKATDGSGIHFTGGRIGPSVLADLLNKVPLGTRQSLAVG